MPTLVIEHSELTGSDRLGEHLRAFGHSLQVVRVHRNEPLPEDLSGIDAVISCGGGQSPKAKEAWVKQEIALLAEADATGRPVLGICLGSQLLARALGGKVAKLRKPIVGWHDVHLTPAGREDALLAGQPWTWRQLHWHQWEVKELPDGAAALATSDRCDVEAWRHGMRTYAVQFHPECQAIAPVAWAGDAPSEVKAAGTTLADLERDTDRCFESYRRLADRFHDAVALLLMPVDRRLVRSRA